VRSVPPGFDATLQRLAVAAAEQRGQEDHERLARTGGLPRYGVAEQLPAGAPLPRPAAVVTGK
jgi:hypothetical protein